MTIIWAWCLVFVISGQQPIVQFDYKTEADCDASRIAVKAQQPDTQSQSWCVPIVKPDKLNHQKSNKRKLVRKVERRSPPHLAHRRAR
jgi:hypothetical protein